MSDTTTTPPASVKKERHFIVECEIRTGEEEYTIYSRYCTDGEDYTDEDYIKEWLGDDFMEKTGIPEADRDEEYDDDGKEIKETPAQFAERCLKEGFWIDDVRMINYFIIKEATAEEYKVLQKFI